MEVCLGLVADKYNAEGVKEFRFYELYVVVYIFHQIVGSFRAGCVYFRIYRCDFSVNIQVYLISVSYSVHLEACCVYVRRWQTKTMGKNNSKH